MLGKAKCNRCKQKLSIWAMDASLEYKTCKRCGQETLLEAALQKANALGPPPARPTSAVPSPHCRCESYASDGDSVWKALQEYLATSGHDVVSSDLQRGQVIFTTHMSAFSPGEKYDVVVSPDGAGRIRVSVTGLKKNFAYSLQPARIEKITTKIFDAILAAVGGVSPWATNG